MIITGQSVSFGGSGKVKDLPDFTYTGTSVLGVASSYGLVGDYHVLELQTSGTLTFAKKFNADVFMVGGGAGGTTATVGYTGGGGGGSGYTLTEVYEIGNLPIEVTIGAGGSASSAGGNTVFGYLSVNGGSTGSSKKGGNGGSGGGNGGYTLSGGVAPAGSGGSDGSNGNQYTDSVGSGQGTTTRAFKDSNGTLYAGGGGGGGYYKSSSNGTGAAGGTGGGGTGGQGSGISSSEDRNGKAGTPNTGSGGGGGGAITNSLTNGGIGGSGGSGIILIRIAQS